MKEGEFDQETSDVNSHELLKNIENVELFDTNFTLPRIQMKAQLLQKIKVN